VVGANTLRPEGCKKARDDIYDRVVPALDPDVIVIMNRGYEQPNQFAGYLGPDLEPLDPSSRAGAAVLHAAVTSSLRSLEAPGRKIVVIEPIPYETTGFDPLACLSQAEVLAECVYSAPAQPTGLEQLYRQLDRANHQLWSMDIDTLVCPFFPICDPIVNGEVVKVDGHHLTSAFATSLAPAVESFLLRNGIVP
jgi:hypothetical protein